MTHSHKFQSAATARDFAIAGKAFLTLQSEKTGTHFTYRVKQAEGKNGKPAGVWFVGVLTGGDNSRSYSYAGVLREKGDDGIVFQQTAKSKVSEDAPSVKAWQYFWKNVCNGTLPNLLTVRHENKCGRCGRKLTVPESIDNGIGPECANKLGHAGF